MTTCVICSSEFEGKNYNAKYCSSCVSIGHMRKNDEWNKRNPEKKSEYNKRRYLLNKEKVAKINEDWRLSNWPQIKARQRRQVFKKKYGLSEEDYYRMATQQSGRCAICDEFPILNNRLYVDHCHVSGKVRGLLCSKCNSGLGFFKDSLQLVDQAKKYLERYNSDGFEREPSNVYSKSRARLGTGKLPGATCTSDRIRDTAR